MHNNSYASSPVWRRLAAFLYDCLLLTAIYFVVTAIAIVFNDGQAIIHRAYFLLLYLIAFLFFAWFWRHGGQTLGMRAWHVRVTDENGGVPSWMQCAKRFAAGSLLLPISLPWALFDGQGKALHDRLSSTITCYKSNR